MSWSLLRAVAFLVFAIVAAISAGAIVEWGARSVEWIRRKMDDDDDDE